MPCMKRIASTLTTEAQILEVVNVWVLLAAKDAYPDESIAKKDANLQRAPHVGSPFPESFVQNAVSAGASLENILRLC